MKKALSLIMALVMIASCFSLSMTASAAATEVIAGSSVATAKAVSFDTDYVSSLVVADETDWYKVTTLSEPATYTFSATSDQISIHGDVEYGLNLVVYQLGADGKTLTQIAVICNNGKVTPKLEMNTTYYFKVYAGKYAEDKYGQYKFNVECVTHKETVVLSSISVSKLPDKKIYVIGEELDTKGMVVTALYSDGSMKDVSDLVYISNFDSSTEGKKTLTVFYREGDFIKDCTFDVNVIYEVVLQEIKVTTMPAKTVYSVGEKFAYDGMVITAIYSDGTSKRIRGGYFYEDPDTSTAGIKDVVVIFTDTGVTCKHTIQIEVIDKAPGDTLIGLSVASNPVRTTFYVGETFNYSGLVIKATYADGSSKAVTGYTVSTVDTSTVGEKTVTVSYTENGITKSCTFKVNVINAPVVVTLNSISINTLPSKTAYKVGETANYSGLSIKAVFSDGSTTVVPYSACSITGFTTSSVGTKVVTVSYSYGSVFKTTTFTITVSSPYTVCPTGKVDVVAPANSIRYGDVLVLTASTKNIPSGTISWEFIGSGFSSKIAADGESCQLTCTGSGSVIVKVQALDADGNPVVDADGNFITDTLTINLDGGFIAKLISFFKNLFGIARTIIG